MLCTREYPACLTCVYPLRRGSSNCARIGAERARADDWIFRLDVEIANWLVNPIDPKRARFACAERGCSSQRLFVAERRNCGERRQSNRACELLSRAALEVSADEKWDARSCANVCNQIADLISLSAE